MEKYAIIVAGGSGLRMGTNLPKQFLLLRDKPLLWYSISAFEHAFIDIKIILVLPEAYLEKGSLLLQSTARPENILLAAGGATRFESVRNGLNHTPGDSIVFIHDGVRCLLTPQLIKRCYEETILHGNAIPAISVVDTLRIQTKAGSEMIDRNRVRAVQTPQTFFSNTIKRAFLQDYQESFTDDAIVAESAGEKIHLVEGEHTNIKITRQIDLLIAEKILEERGITG